MTNRQNKGWILLIYRVPSKPSTSRVAIWKRTKELGAFLLQQSVYILPNLPQLKNALKEFKDQVQEFGGECKLLEVASLEADEEKEVIAGFNRLRDEEYREVIEGCEELLREIVKETKAEKFYFAELEELEKDLQKLKEWSAAVIQRDFFGAGLRDDVSRLMIECEDKFNNFSQQVLACEEPTVREGETGVAGPQLRRELKRIKQKEKQVYTKGELIAKLKEVLSKLENETLTVGEEQVDALPESVTLELEYKGHEGSKTLEIELKWQ